MVWFGVVWWCGGGCVLRCDVLVEVVWCGVLVEVVGCGGVVLRLCGVVLGLCCVVEVVVVVW